VEAETRARLLETEYVGVTAEAVAQARTEATEAVAREERLGQAKAGVDRVAERAAGAARSVGDLRACARDLREAARPPALSPSRRWTWPPARGRVDGGGRRHRRRCRRRRSRPEGRAAFCKAEGSWGVRDLSAAVSGAWRARGRVASSPPQPTPPRPRPRPRQARGRRGDAPLRVADAEATLAAFEGAREAVDLATHADPWRRCSGLSVGDDCPVRRSDQALPSARKPALEGEAGAARQTAPPPVQRVLTDATVARDAASRPPRRARGPRA
jgi:hypothetical protein